MASVKDETWSDSEDEQVLGQQTSILLGIPDGLVNDCDLLDAAVSRIGGRPVRFRFSL